MVRHEDECVGCPENMGCLGSACPYKDVVYIECDECGSSETIYELDGDEQLCKECWRKRFPVVYGKCSCCGETDECLELSGKYCGDVLMCDECWDAYFSEVRDEE